ncbi:MAG: electron transfer flavoprotein subunit alpha/FixB family protein [Candidatus Limnocylindrales bacterium]
MSGAIWAIAEQADGDATRLSLELATLARELATTAGREASTVLVGAAPSSAAAMALAACGPGVLAIEVPTSEATASAATVAVRVAALARARQPAIVLVGASQDGKDVAGQLGALLDWGVLVNGSAVRWSDDGPVVEMSTFGGRLITASLPLREPVVIVVRPGSVTADAAAAPGTVEALSVVPERELPPVRIVERVTEASAAASIEEARVIVAGGRGVGGPEGFGIIRDLADALGGAVGATRAVVDAGWIGYSQQIGQTGKIVKPALYVAAGISGAIQHKVGMQTSGAIVAINRDPDAPIVEFADLVVIGDLFQIVPRLTAALRARTG